MGLYIICHTSRKTNHLCSTTLFSQDAECNAKSQSRHTGWRESPRNKLLFDTSFSFDFSSYRSFALSLCSLSLSRSFISVSISLYLLLRWSLYPSLFPSLYYVCLSPPLDFSLFTHNHSLTRSDSPLFLFIPPTHSLDPHCSSLFLSFLFLFPSVSFFFFLSLEPPPCPPKPPALRIIPCVHDSHTTRT